MQTNKAGVERNLAPAEDDIIDVLTEDHKLLKELVQIMKDSDKPLKERKEAFQEFGLALISHAKPEEQILYTALKQNKELRSEGFEGDVEHGLADQMLEEAKRTTDEDLWTARVKVLAELVEHHIKEEENDIFPDFRKASDPADRREMGNQFLKLKLDYLAAGGENIIPDPKLNSEMKH